jgi:dihydroceramidase
LQWCEEDYYASYYCAEIVNTLTNILFVYLSYKGVKSCWKHGHDTVFAVAYFGYFLVGFGSFMFHATLKYPWQLVDELNMIYTTCLMAYASLSYAQSVRTQTLLGTFLTLLCIGITVYYHHIQDPTFHQQVYAALTVFIVFRSGWIMETSLRPYFRKDASKTAAEDARDRAILKNMWFFVAYGLTIFLSGFAIWGIDNVYCGTLRRWRRQIGLPWGILLEGHGWWHLMTGVGAYCYIVWGIHLRRVLNGEQDKFVIHWPKFWTLPEIVKVDDAQLTKPGALTTKENGKPTGKATGGRAANGELKKRK